MSLSRITERYAKSLLELANETNQLNEVLSDIRGFLKLSNERDFLNLLKSPIIKKDKKKKIIEEIFGGKVNKLTMMFFNIIIAKGRESILPEIASSFLNLYNASKNITQVELTTAIGLDDTIINEIQNKLSSSMTNQSQIEIDAHTDKTIKGGFILKYGDKLYDASLAHKISELRKELIK